MCLSHTRLVGNLGAAMQEEGDFSVDTEVVMAYTDESVRHFLQAMELTETLDAFEREW